MKEKLLERLELMNKAIEDQHLKLQQASADLNMLNGCKQELVHIINLCDESKSEAHCENENCDDPNHPVEAAA